MLPAGSRLRRRADFISTMRGSRGVRGAGLLVVHVRVPATGGLVTPASRPARVGFAVSRAVGPAVTRNLVRRRLRHLVAARTGQLPTGSTMVVRALPPSAQATYAELDAALDKALRSALTRAAADRP